MQEGVDGAGRRVWCRKEYKERNKEGAAQDGGSGARKRDRGRNQELGQEGVSGLGRREWCRKEGVGPERERGAGKKTCQEGGPASLTPSCPTPFLL